MDLFAPAVDPQLFHPNFSHVLTKATEYDRDVLRSWADGFVDRDGKFVKEFQTTFNSSFWELYLFAVLKELGVAVDFNHSAPDFVVGGDNPFCIEAVTANSAVGNRPEWQADVQDLEGVDLEAMLDEATIRLANAVTSKHRKYRNRYAALAHVHDKPFVLAVAPFEQPFFWFQNSQAINRVLYTFDRVGIEPHPETGELGVMTEFLEYITKPNGSQVPLGYFVQPTMAEISAVIFSNTATWGKVRALSGDPNPNVVFETIRYNENAPGPFHSILPRAEYSESLLDGLYIFHNPHALRPLNPALFQLPGVTQYRVDDLSFPVPEADAQHGALLQRHVITLPAPSAALR